jgi:hypothetical protein
LPSYGSVNVDVAAFASLHCGQSGEFVWENERVSKQNTDDKMSVDETGLAVELTMLLVVSVNSVGFLLDRDDSYALACRMYIYELGVDSIYIYTLHFITDMWNNKRLSRIIC